MGLAEAARILRTPVTTSPTVLREPRASSGISMSKASSTSKEILILSRESIARESKVLSSEMDSGEITLRFCDDVDDARWAISSLNRSLGCP